MKIVSEKCKSCGAHNMVPRNNDDGSGSVDCKACGVPVTTSSNKREPQPFAFSIAGGGTGAQRRG